MGGGSAGSVVASRLSEDGNITVLLLEAGPRPPVLTDVPGFTGYFGDSNIEWDFKSVPQINAAGGHKDKVRCDECHSITINSNIRVINVYCFDLIAVNDGKIPQVKNRPTISQVLASPEMLDFRSRYRSLTFITDILNYSLISHKL